MTRKTLALTRTVPVPTLVGGSPGTGDLPGRLWRTVLLWQARARERSRLAEMDEPMRRDSGLTWEALQHEANKPFWLA